MSNGNITQIKRGRQAPSVDDLELWELGYSYETKSLYIKEKDVNNIVRVVNLTSGAGTGGGGGESSSRVFQITKENNNLTNDQFVNSWATMREQMGFVFLAGDLLILRVPLTNDLFEHFAYVYDTNGDWVALTRSYSSDNVYFSDDLQTTVAIGNITIPSSGMATISAAGKNLNQVWNEIFVKELIPTITQPSVSCSINQNKTVEVGSVLDVSWQCGLNTGKYQYGPETQVTFNNITITDTLGNTSSELSGTFEGIVVTDNMQYSITIRADHSEAATTPVTNIGNEYPDGKISAGEKTSTGGTLRGYRKCFYGAIPRRIDSEEDITSDLIRELNSTTGPVNSNTELDVWVDVGDICTIIAYPASVGDIEKIIDVTGMSTTVTSSFTKYQFPIAGANGYDSISYNIYVNPVSKPYDASKQFKVLF